MKMKMADCSGGCMDYTKASESDLFDVLYFIPSPTLFVCFHAGSV